MLLSFYSPEETWNFVARVPAVVVVSVYNRYCVTAGANNVSAIRKTIAEFPNSNTFRTTWRKQEWLKALWIKILSPHRVCRRHVEFLPPNPAKIIICCQPANSKGSRNSSNNTIRYLFSRRIGIVLYPHDSSPSPLAFLRNLVFRYLVICDVPDR